MTARPEIFDTACRRAKRRRALDRFGSHDFLHEMAAKDIVDRLESTPHRFTRALICGAAPSLVTDALTDAAGVDRAECVADVLPDGPPADFAALPYGDAQFDLVVSLFALHAANDPSAILREASRVLKPDGLFIATFPGERTLTELRAALGEAEAEVTGRGVSRIFPFIAVKDGGALMQHAGFALPVADVDRVRIQYATPRRLLNDLRGMGETNCLAAAPRGAIRREVLARAEALYIERHAAPDDGVIASFDLLTLTGWKPAPGQPRPLAPGSAKTSLKDVLN